MQTTTTRTTTACGDAIIRPDDDLKSRAKQHVEQLPAEEEAQQ
jgi:hypothetical protein